MSKDQAVHLRVAGPEHDKGQKDWKEAGELLDRVHVRVLEQFLTVAGAASVLRAVKKRGSHIDVLLGVRDNGIVENLEPTANHGARGVQADVPARANGEEDQAQEHKDGSDRQAQGK